MPALDAILAALALAVRRELGGFRALRVNNFFLVIALMVYSAMQSGVWPHAAEPLILLMGVLLLFPLSSDPLDLMPPSRLNLFPLSKRQRAALRLVSLVLSPALWIAGAVLAGTGRFAAAALVVALSAGSRLLGAGTERPGHGIARLVPELPGRLGGLVRHGIRQLMVTLDFWLALALAAGGTVYRMSGGDREAMPVIGLFVALALSTYAQCLFGMDRAAGSPMTRYRLLPLAGWQILLAKDLGFLSAVALFTAPLDIAAGLTFGLTALAVGHHPSVFVEDALRPWRFCGSRVFPAVVQGVSSLMLGFGEVRHGLVFLAAAALCWIASLVIYGRFLTGRGLTRFDKQSVNSGL